MSASIVLLILGMSTAQVTRGASDSAEFSRAVKHQTSLINGVRLHYVTGGKGPKLVLLHGLPASWYEWRRILPTSAERYTVIAPDLRGLGDSSKPAGGYDAHTAAEDIHQLVRSL